MNMGKYLLALLALGLGLHSQAKFFEATGIGDTPEEAKKDAVENAIKFSVGEFMVNREKLSNEELDQTIVSYSNAYVKRIDVISQEKVDNEYNVKVSVDIESQKLLSLLKEIQETHITNAIDNKTLMEAINHFDKNDINAQNINNFSELVEELLVTPVKENKELVRIEVIGKLKALNPENERKGSVLYPSSYNNTLFPLQLNIKLTPSKEYISAFKRILEEAKEDKNNNSIPIYERNLGDNKRIYLSSRMEKKAYYISEDKAEIIIDKLSNLFQHYKFLNIQLLDNEQEEFKEITFCTYDYDCDSPIPRYIDNNDFLFSGVQGFSAALLPVLSQNEGFFSKGSAKIRLAINLTREEISRLKDIKIYFSH